MSATADGGGWDEAVVEALLAPAVRALAPPTSLSPLPYDLNAGVPDRASLPAEALAEAAQAALAEDPAGALTYGGPQGFEPLRQWIAERQARETGLALGPEHVALTSGSAHALDNVAAAFIGPGDVVVVPAPTYPGAIRTFRARGARVVDTPQDEDGVVPEGLAEALRSLAAAGTPAKLVYVQPTYDNPSGSTLTDERRREVVRLAREHRALIVEDDAYAGIDLEGAPPRSLFALAEGRGVIRLGTFSKTVATGLRVGWETASPDAIRRLVFMRFDNGASPFVHRMVLHYLRSGAYEPHVEALRALYRERRDASAAALRACCGTYVSFRPPRGGFFHWLRLREGLDARAVVAAAAERGVAVTPGWTYYADAPERGDRFLRLVYSALPPAALREAIGRLALALAMEQVTEEQAAGDAGDER